MPFNVLLLPLLGGFIFISLWNRTYWHAQRAEKERLLFYASCAGIVFLALAILIRSIPPFIPCVEWYVPVPGSLTWLSVPCLPTWWKANVPFRYSEISTIALVLGLTLWWPLNKWVNPSPLEWARLIDREGGPLEKRLYKAMVEKKWVMITLKNGKVYVGRIFESYAPEKHKTIFLFPLRSGYRNANHQVVPVNNYEDVYKTIRHDNPDDYEEIINDFGMVIPVEEILTATLYRPDIHEKYFSHKESPLLPSEGWPLMLTNPPTPAPPPVQIPSAGPIDMD